MSGFRHLRVRKSTIVTYPQRGTNTLLDGTNNTFAPASTNDVISMNGGTTGGDQGSTVTITALEDNVYLVEAVLIGTGTEATPFADS